MQLISVVAIVTVALALSACKIQISVPEHGTVASESGSINCGSAETCDVEVNDIFFNETFVAKPDVGYEFESWTQDASYLCGGLKVPCPLFTSFFEGNDALMGILESDRVWFLEPRFKKPNSWTTKAQVMTGGVGISACAINGKLYVAGLGWSLGGADRVEEYDPSTDTWTAKANMPTPSAWATASAVNGKCYVIGGGPEGVRQTIDTVQEYDPVLDRWRTRAPLPVGRSAAASAVVNGKIYVVGGGSTFGFRTNGLAPVAIYDPVADQWTSGADMPTPRLCVAAGAIGGYVYVVGGSNSSLSNSSLVHRYDPVNNEWTPRADYPRNVDFASASVHDGSLYVFGGLHPTNLNDTSTGVYRYNPASDSWTRRADMLQKRYSPSSATIDDRILVVAGRGLRESIPLKIVEEYTP